MISSYLSKENSYNSKMTYFVMIQLCVFILKIDMCIIQHTLLKTKDSHTDLSI